MDVETIEAYTRAPRGQPTLYTEVPPSSAITRILELPRRDPEAPVEQLVHQLTNMLRTPWGTEVLRPKQALALAELYQCRGLFAPIVAGGGKSKITRLGPLVTGARRGLLIVPGGLEGETEEKFDSDDKHWMGSRPHVITYQYLCSKKQGVILAADGTVAQEDYLHRFQPDLIMLDEAQAAKDTKKGATFARIDRYLETHPNTIVVALSATFAKLGLVDYAHIAEWCLGGASPVPRESEWKAKQDWCRALDDKVADRLGAGVLAQLYNAEEAELATRGPVEELRAVRSAYRRRLTETPGVVASLDEKLEGIELTLEPLDPGVGDPVMGPLYEQLRKLRMTPSGDPVPDGKEEWSTAREMGLGLHYFWDPPAPRAWMEQRKETFQWARQAVARNNLRIDTFGQLKDAVAVGRVDDGGLMRAWLEIEPTFTPNPVAAWHSDEALNAAANWLHTHPRGVCWVEHKLFARRLAQVAGVPYFAEGGLDDRGVFILKHQGPCIASIAANHRGRNMQFNWDETLIMEFPQSPVIAEQMLARVHRPYQAAPVVRNWVWIGCYEYLAGVDLALIGADATAEREGGAQRILYAKRTLPTIQSVMARGGARWVK